MAVPNETLLIAPGANASITNFSLTAGDQLDLTALLSGAPLAHDLSNLSAYLTATPQSPGQNGASVSLLAVSRPGGTASLALSSTSPISVANLVTANALVLPPH